MTQFIALYVRRPARWLFQVLLNYLWWTYHFFGLGRHFRQLFVPWHRLVAVKTQLGFSLSEWFERTSYNLISRIIGAHVRLLVIVAGLIWMVVVVMAWVVLVGLWVVSLVTLPLLGLVWIFRWNGWQRRLDGLEHDVAGVLKYLGRSQQCAELLSRLGLAGTDAAQILEQAGRSGEVATIVERWRNRVPNPEFELELIEWALLSESSASILRATKISEQDIKQLIEWLRSEYVRGEEQRRFWLRVNLQKSRAIGKSWAYGYTPLLDQYATDLAIGVPAELVLAGREPILEQVERIFSKTGRTNMLLVGPDGVGKTSFCQLFAKHIADGLTTPELADHRVLELDMTSLLARGQRLSALVEIVRQVIAEASAAGNIVLVIPSLDQYLDSATEIPDLSQVFKEIEQDARIKIIGLMNENGYRKTITVNPVIDSSFEVVRMEALSAEETLRVVLRDMRIIEKRHRVIIQYRALKILIEKSARIMPKQSFPQKAFNLLDEILVAARSAGEQMITADFVTRILSQKSGIQLSGVGETEADLLQNLEDRLAERVIGQDQALRAVTSGLQRSRLGLGSTGRPVTTLLFLGPTGVGKTETAKAVAESIYGSERLLQRFDCSQYVSADSVAALIGSPAHQGQPATPGTLTAAIETQPQGVVLFDELEKAHISVHNVLLTLIDEGYITDALGTRLSFEHSIFIATSNAASHIITELFAQTAPESLSEQAVVDELRSQVIQKLLTDRVFSPEFLNRFDEIVLFSPLNHQSLLHIARLKVSKLAHALKQEHGVILEVNDQVLEELAAQAYDPQFGARELERILRRQLTDRITQQLLSNGVVTGQTLVIDSIN